MSETEDASVLWQSLSADAANGSLRLQSDIAGDLQKACEAMISELQSLAKVAQYLGRMSGYGDLPSALALAGKFERKAVGGVDALVTRFEQNITVVKLIQETVSHSVSRLVEEDRDLAGALPSVEGPR